MLYELMRISMEVKMMSHLCSDAKSRTDAMDSIQSERSTNTIKNHNTASGTLDKTYGTMRFNFVSTILHKLTNILIPAEMQNNTLAKTNQPLFIPDVFVDKNICTPIFESVHGRATLLVPEYRDSMQYQMSPSIDNSYVWYSTKESNETEKNDSVCTTKSGKKKMITNQGPSRIANNAHGYSKSYCKNRKEKHRHDVLLDIMDDFRVILDEEETDSEPEKCDSLSNIDAERLTKPMNCESLANSKLPDKTLAVNNSHNSRSNSEFHDGSSVCDSEDSFVIFCDDPQTTPSVSPKINKNICNVINMFLKAPISFPRKQQRHLSECSDDSIVFCYDSDYDEAYDQLGTDSESIDMEKHECDNDSCCDEMFNESPEQPDSGFEEKKVRFNSNVDIHVMRTWDFAYRQARKGEWEMAARDRERFKKRIDEVDKALGPILQPDVRERIYCDRFSS
ncbi:uncharacterized protein LOC129770651 [Toxorhynchites rutilus septentrionalis]|uniref:uncharacterized protein LOC129770651 n=1 Tax=Toxorhynchites rutilus septentrionalis TaxID=329112 RepID=UPI00247AADBB|nr:uncharacterized protein LOC129770651 [Toxorhynchites rutilus septentrionalis]